MVILAIITTILSLIVFLSSDNIIYIQSKEYGRIDGVGSVLNEGNKKFYSTENLMGGLSTIIIIISVCVVIAVICALFKKTKVISLIVCILLSLIGIIVPFTASITNDSKMEYIGNDIAVYGSGSNAGIASGGWLSIFMSIIAICFTVFVLIKVIMKNTEVSEEEKEKYKDMNYSDFSL